MTDSDRRLSIAYCTWEDPEDGQSYSGVHYHLLRTLRRHCGDVTCLGPIANPYLELSRKYDRFSRLFLGHGIDPLHATRVARAFARRVEEKLSAIECDVVFAPVSSETIAYVETDVPIVYMADATFALLVDGYSAFSGLSDRSRRESHEVERLSIEKAARVVYTSEWAAESGVRDYGCPKEKVRVELMGCNLKDPPSREHVLGLEREGPCRLLFVGRQWVRKGGDIARDALVHLLEQGVDTHLTAIGCFPPSERMHERMQVISYLDKDDPLAARRYFRELERATFLIAPTRRDCSPMILSEAAAYGLPVITTAVGGVPGLVREGESGYALPLEAGPSDYADLIRELHADRPRYRRMVEASRDLYETELNWDRFGRNLARVFTELVPGSGC